MEVIQPKVRAPETGQVCHRGGRSRDWGFPVREGCCVLVQSGEDPPAGRGHLLCLCPGTVGAERRPGGRQGALPNWVWQGPI